MVQTCEVGVNPSIPSAEKLPHPPKRQLSAKRVHSERREERMSKQET
jgi:hypothetical protein